MGGAMGGPGAGVQQAMMGSGAPSGSSLQSLYGAALPSASTPALTPESTNASGTVNPAFQSAGTYNAMPETPGTSMVGALPGNFTAFDPNNPTAKWGEMNAATGPQVNEIATRAVTPFSRKPKLPVKKPGAPRPGVPAAPGQPAAPGAPPAAPGQPGAGQYPWEPHYGAAPTVAGRTPEQLQQQYGQFGAINEAAAPKDLLSWLRWNMGERGYAHGVQGNNIAGASRII